MDITGTLQCHICLHRAHGVRSLGRRGRACGWAAAAAARLFGHVLPIGVARALGDSRYIQRWRQTFRHKADILETGRIGFYWRDFAARATAATARWLGDFGSVGRDGDGHLLLDWLGRTRDALGPLIPLAAGRALILLFARSLGLTLGTALGHIAIGDRATTIVIVLAVAALLISATIRRAILVALGIAVLVAILRITAITIRTPVLAPVLAIAILLAALLPIAILAVARLVIALIVAILAFALRATVLVAASLLGLGLFAALALILIIRLVLVERRTLDAPRRDRPAIFLKASARFGEHAEIMVGELEVIFDVDAVALHLRVARKRLVFFEQLGGITARAIVDAIAAILTTRIATRRALLLPATAATATGLTIIDQVLVVLSSETKPAVLQNMDANAPGPTPADHTAERACHGRRTTALP